MTTATVSKKLNNRAKAFLLHALTEMVCDPDFGSELTAKAKRRLKNARNYGGKTVALPAIKRKYY